VGFHATLADPAGACAVGWTLTLPVDLPMAVVVQQYLDAGSTAPAQMLQRRTNREVVVAAAGCRAHRPPPLPATGSRPARRRRRSARSSTI